jgi:hypothetical protein
MSFTCSLHRLRSCEILVQLLLTLQFIALTTFNIMINDSASNPLSTHFQTVNITKNLNVRKDNYSFTNDTQNQSYSLPIVNESVKSSLIIPAKSVKNRKENYLVEKDIQNQSYPLPTFNQSIKSTFPNLWDESKILPQWIKDYFSWHRYQRSKLTKKNWREFKFCVMRCLDTDMKCGGTADRIKTIPFVLYWAARTKRILMIHWSRPASLESFLLPPVGGMDWRIPDWMVREVVWGPFCGNINHMEKHFSRNERLSVIVKLQSYNGGSLYYNQYIHGPSFEEIYHDVWRTIFTPSLPIQKIIQKHLNTFNLRPGEYTAAHLRGLYGITDRPKNVLHKMAQNAINCAIKLRPEGPIYFASDSKEAVDHVIDSISPSTDIKIIALKRQIEPLHLEKSRNWENRSVSEYYDTFVDLYLLALSACLTYNVGGYGQWALWISKFPTCFNQHGTNVSPWIACNGTHVNMTQALDYSAENDGQIFLPPMPQNHIPQAIGNRTMELLYSLNNTWSLPKNNSITLKIEPMTSSLNIPDWLRRYFEWHKAKTSSLSEKTWKQSNYLVMECLEYHERCGGLSDRLRPIPTLLLIAAQSERLLFIRWTRPFPLEEFLIPTSDGIDWRVPSWLTPHLEGQDNYGTLTTIIDNSKKQRRVLRTKYQSHTYGTEYYNNNIESGSVTFEEGYHHIFNALFKPSPLLAQELESSMKSLGLVPGEYAAAHFRALYGRTYRPYNETIRVAVNGVNCASALKPGGKVFFAADNKVAIDYVREYASREKLPIVSLSHQDEPLHLDKASNWSQRVPSDYYPTFIDLYLLGQSKCLAYSNGGFGTFGLLLSFNYSCSVRFFGKRILKECPNWVNA